MKKMTVNIVIDVLMLVATSLLSFSGFLLEGILPHCHGKGGVLKAFLGMGRHTWADIHLYSVSSRSFMCHRLMITLSL